MNQEICQSCNSSFTIDQADTAFYKSMHVPAPTLCPDCRLQRRMAFRNERSLYVRNCDLCGKQMISMYHAQSPFTVYCQPCWWSDKWDPMSFGQEYDPKKSFFEQFHELLKRTPLPALFSLYQTLENSEYTNLVTAVKNCYLISNSDYNENCAYGSEIESSKDCVDNLMINQCESCYESVNCQQCYQAFYSIDCESCHNIWFSKNLVGCSDCFGCVNLRKQQYCIFNTQYSKEDYFKKLESFGLGTREGLEAMRQQVKEFFAKFPQKYMHGRFNKNVSGDYIYHANEVANSYIITETQNTRYSQWMLVKPVKDCWDYTEYGDNAQRVYDTVTAGGGMSDIMFSWYLSGNCVDVQYSAYCFNSVKHAFGCVGLRSQEYCILNKKYTKAEYDQLKTAIIDQMKEYGEFFPIALSPFGYNETTAQEYFPLGKEQANEKGYKWHEQEKKTSQATTSSEILPCKHNMQCNHSCTTIFRVIPQELAFYNNHKLPLPDVCPNCRHYKRLAYRNPFKSWQRNCQCAGIASDNAEYKNTAEHFHKTDHCPKQFITSYAPDRLDIIYCDDCYLSEVT